MLAVVTEENPERDTAIWSRPKVVAAAQAFALTCLILAFSSLLPAAEGGTAVNGSHIIEVGLLSIGTVTTGVIAYRRRSWGFESCRTLLKIMGGFCALAALSSTWSPSASLALAKTAEVAAATGASIMLGSWAASNLSSSRSLPTIMTIAILATSAVMLAMSIFSPLSHLARSGASSGSRLALGGAHPLELADMFALAMIAILSSNMWHSLRWPCLAAVATAFGLTQPRGALGGITVGLAAMIVVSITSRRTQFVICAAFIILASMTALVAWDDMAEYIDDIAPPDVVTLNGRTDVWEFCLPLVQERPWIGYGYYSSRDLLLDQFKWAGHSHNSYLEVTLSMGFGGLAICLGLIGYAGHLAWRTKNVWLGGTLGYVSTVAMLDPQLMTPTVPMVIILVAAAHARMRETQSAREPVDGAEPLQEGSLPQLPERLGVVTGR